MIFGRGLKWLRLGVVQTSPRGAQLEALKIEGKGLAQLEGFGTDCTRRYRV